MLNQIPANRCEWLVPGLLEEKVAALLKTVPQKHRHRLQPMAESAGGLHGGFEGASSTRTSRLSRCCSASWKSGCP
jgi:ATP-dependent helicase HrpA